MGFHIDVDEKVADAKEDEKAPRTFVKDFSYTSKLLGGKKSFKVEFLAPTAKKNTRLALSGDHIRRFKIVLYAHEVVAIHNGMSAMLDDPEVIEHFKKAFAEVRRAATGKTSGPVKDVKGVL